MIPKKRLWWWSVKNYVYQLIAEEERSSLSCESSIRKLAFSPSPVPFRNISRPVLFVLSFIYGFAQRFHRQFRSRFPGQMVTSLPIPVISVGNFTWGGTGKTPLVEWLSNFYLERKLTPIILTRGYGEDESLMLKAHLPSALLAVGRFRVQIADALLNEKAYLKDSRDAVRIALLDDGAQLYAFRRELELLVLNCLAPFGNRCLIPRGNLRESPEFLVRRSHFALLNHSNLVSPARLIAIKRILHRMNPTLKILYAQMTPRYVLRYHCKGGSFSSCSSQVLPVSILRKYPLLVFCGLGSAVAFAECVRDTGADLRELDARCDHFPFGVDDLQDLCRRAQVSGCLLLTSEKDFLRCESEIMKTLSITGQEMLVLVSKLQVLAEPPREAKENGLRTRTWNAADKDRETYEQFENALLSLLDVPHNKK